MQYLNIFIGLLWASLLQFTSGDAPDGGGIHLNIEYPNNDMKGGLDVDTGSRVEPSDVKTPVVIIAPKPLLDYERLYKKMMDTAPRPGSNGAIEKEVLYNEKVVHSDPVSRRQLLFELLKDAEADLAFYRADYSEMELLLSAQRR